MVLLEINHHISSLRVWYGTINVLSHRLFMAIVYAMVLSVIYIWIQL